MKNLLMVIGIVLALGSVARADVIAEPKLPDPVKRDVNDKVIVKVAGFAVAALQEKIAEQEKIAVEPTDVRAKYYFKRYRELGKDGKISLVKILHATAWNPYSDKDKTDYSLGLQLQAGQTTKTLEVRVHKEDKASDYSLDTWTYASASANAGQTRAKVRRSFRK